MMTLYNLASKLGGCVASTDNFSELAPGFWTLHGDVGDISYQALTKSWEVRCISRTPEFRQCCGCYSNRWVGY